MTFFAHIIQLTDLTLYENKFSSIKKIRFIEK
ncbi:MAG: hypothetical protein H6Q14_2283 [Bacteroidetes bacterium]|jgi:hypothetical protein|nr:hypothetical protein [Bacteroidota bacterium]